MCGGLYRWEVTLGEGLEFGQQITGKVRLGRLGFYEQEDCFGERAQCLKRVD